jgi:outer membrane protein OmpA-like peptidoglycan-associated protein
MARLSGCQAPDNRHGSQQPAPARAAAGRRAQDAILALQRTAGNGSVNRLMVQRQTLGGGAPGDRPGGGGAGFTSSTSTETLTGFGTSSADLTPEHQATLDRLAGDLNAQPLVFGGFVTLVGFADRRGDEGENQALGQRRAYSVRDYLQGLVTDDETRQQIRAYSLGAPREGAVADDPSLRKVEITITRRSYDLGLPGLTPPGLTPPGSGTPDIWHLPPGQIPTPDSGHPQLPDWFWRQLPPRPADPSFISQLSRWLNETLRTSDLARIGASIAGGFGFNQAQVRRMLEDAFQSGGESAVKELLNSIIRAAAGPPTRAAVQPVRAAGQPDPVPEPAAPTAPDTLVGHRLGRGVSEARPALAG